MEQDFISMFGKKPKAYVSPLEPGDHPELDESDLLDLEGINQYQSLIGSFQLAVQLESCTAMMTLSAYRSAPRMGHLERAKHLIGYLLKNRNAPVRIPTELPDFSGIDQPAPNWSRTPYAGAREVADPQALEPLGKPVKCTTFVDANLYHCLISGRAVTGILHFFNGTPPPVNWYSKKQTTVQMATFGSEFVAARIATDQIISNRVALRYLGVPIEGHTILYGDNQSVVDNSTIPHSRLNKRRIALSYHRVQEAICANIMTFVWLDSKHNPADILSKHWSRQMVCDLLHSLLFMTSFVKESLVTDPIGHVLSPSVCHRIIPIPHESRKGLSLMIGNEIRHN
jgi:hypothetical protein